MSLFWNDVRIRFPTYLYAGMPPARAWPLTIIREPKTASAVPDANGATSRSISSGAYWPSAWRSTTMSSPWSTAQA